jgi:hypothetical protein
LFKQIKISLTIQLNKNFKLYDYEKQERKISKKECKSFSR